MFNLKAFGPAGAEGFSLSLKAHAENFDELALVLAVCSSHDLAPSGYSPRVARAKPWAYLMVRSVSIVSTPPPPFLHNTELTNAELEGALSAFPEVGRAIEQRSIDDLYSCF